MVNLGMVYILAFYLTYVLAFYLASILTFYLAVFLAIYLAFYLAIWSSGPGVLHSGTRRMARNKADIRRSTRLRPSPGRWGKKNV